MSEVKIKLPELEKAWDSLRTRVHNSFIDVGRLLKGEITLERFREIWDGADGIVGDERDIDEAMFRIAKALDALRAELGEVEARR